MTLTYQKAADKARSEGKIALALRIELEIKIARQLLTAIDINEIKYLEVNGMEMLDNKTDKVMEYLTESDEGELIIHYKNDDTAYFQFVFGNDGYDLINDYGGHESDELYTTAMKGVST